MKLTRKEALELNHVLGTTDFELPISNRFRYATTKNIRITKDEVDAVNESFKAPEGFDEYNAKRIEVLRSFNINTQADLDALTGEAREEFERASEKFAEENKDIIEAIKKLEEDKLEFLKEEIELDLYKVSLDDVPNISGNNQFPHWEIWRVIELIIKED